MPTIWTSDTFANFDLYRIYAAETGQPPIMTQAQIDALTPAFGMLVANSDTMTLQFYNGTSWGDVLTNN